ncbi:MAG: hypothetical protein QOE70_5064 [Chthoniobacter sp.]|jgi:hypothetical protein|nr:hypothetical protein [Chthoniobacter sp.]
MNHSLLRSVLIASLLFIGLLPSSFSAAEEEKPEEPHAALAAQARQLRGEVEALRHRVEQLEKAPPANASDRDRRDSGERDRLLAETQQILTHFQDGKAAAWEQAHGKIRDLRRQLAAALTDLQDGYTRRARLEEAVAIRDAISFIKDPGRNVLSDPGLLRSAAETSRILFFRVTGAPHGSLYGTDVYTSDSTLATAAVHAGVLRVGQTGIVKVTTIPSHQGYAGSTRNGITSSSWGSYPGFRVEALGDEDQDLNDGATGDASTARTGSTALSGNDSPKHDPRSHPSHQPVPWTPDLPAALPGEAREQIRQFTEVAADLRKSARDQVFHLAREAVGRLAPIQDAHTRGSRLDEAIAVRSLIRNLTEYTEPR